MLAKVLFMFKMFSSLALLAVEQSRPFKVNMIFEIAPILDVKMRGNNYLIISALACAIPDIEFI